MRGFAIFLFFVLLTSSIAAQVGSDELGSIVLWRSGEHNHPNLRNRVALNDILFSNLSKRNYIRLDLPPGEYELEVGHIELVSDQSNDKWVHPDEGGVFKVNLKAGVTYNIEGRMKKMDSDMDTTVTDDQLRYYVDMERYRGSYSFLQSQLSARALSNNRDHLYTKVHMVLGAKRKMDACIIRTDKNNYYVMELGVGYLYEQAIPRSQVRSIERIIE